MRSYKLLIFIVIFVLAGSLLYALQVKIKNKQYKRTHQNALSLITGKKAAEAALPVLVVVAIFQDGLCWWTSGPLL